MDPNNFVGASGDGYDVYVGGRLIGHYTDLNAAQSAFNTARGGGTATTPGTNAPTGVPGVSAGAGAGAVAGATGGLVDPGAIKALMDLASQNAQQAYLNARLELEKQTAGQQWTAKQEELAQAAAHDAWQKTIAGREAEIQAAATTGYVGGIADVSNRVTAAWNRLPPEQRTGAMATAIWKSQVPGLTDAEAAAMNDAAHQYAAVNGTAMPADIMGQALSQITNGRITGQTATLAREQFNAKTAQDLLDLGSRLRGPDDAFAYARTLANVPPAMRAQLDALMRQQGISYTSPGLGAMAGQFVQGGLGGQTQQVMGEPTMQAQVMPTYQGPGVPQGYANAVQAAGGAPQTAGAAPWNAAMASTPAPTGMAGATQTGGNYLTYQGPTGQPTGGTPPTDLRTASGTQTGTSAMSYAGNPTGAATPTGLGQISPQQWGRTNSYVQRLMLAGLEAGGSDKSAELDAFQKQLPKYAGPTRARMAA